MTTAVTFDDGRQNPCATSFPFTFDQLTSAVFVPLIKLPTNAVLISLYAIIDTVFNSATSDTISIGDQPTGASARPTQYAAAVTAQALGKLAGAAPTGYKYAAAGSLGIVWTGVGAAPTTGAGRLIVEYIIDGRATEVQDR